MRGAVACYREGINAIEILEAMLRKEGIDAGFERKKSLQVAHSEKAVADLEKEYNYRKAHGFRVEWLSTEEISVRYNMASHPGILSEEGASIDAFRAAHELISRNHAGGMQVFDHTAVKEFQYEPSCERSSPKRLPSAASALSFVPASKPCGCSGRNMPT